MEVARAYVTIRPDFSGFRRELNEGLRAATAGVTADVKVNADTAGAVRQIKAATRNQRVEVKVDTDHTTLGRFTKALGLAGKQANLFKLGVEGIRLAGLVTGLIGATGALVSMGGAAVGVVGALAPLSGLAATLPGLLGGAATGFGVLKLAFAGVGDALKASSKGTKEFQEALKKLPPEARPFVEFLVGLKPKLEDLTRVAQRNLFPALKDGLQGLVANYFPMFRQAVNDASNVLRGLVDQGARMLTSGPWRADVQRILQANNTTLARFGQIGLDVVDALRHITIAAIPLTDWLAQLLQKWAEGAKRAAEMGRASGGLAQFFHRTAIAAQSLFGIVGNLVGAFFNVINAAAPLGTSVLGDLEAATRKLRAFTSGDENQARLRKFFEDLRPAIAAIKELLKGAAGAAITLVAKLKELADAAARFAGQHPGIAKSVGQFLALAAIGKYVGVAGLVGQVGTLATASLPLSLVVGAIVGIGAAGYLAYTKVKPFRDAIDNLGRTIRDIAKPVLEGAAKVIKNDLIPAVQKALPFVRDQLVNGIKDVTKALRDNKPQIQAVGNLLVTVGGWIARNVIPWLIKLYAIHLRSLLGVVGSAIRIIGALIEAFRRWWKAMTDTVRNIVNFVSAVKTRFESMRASAGEKVAGIVKFFRELPGKAKAGFLAGASGLVSSIVGKFASIRDRAKGPINGILRLINGFIGKVNNLPGVDFKPVTYLNEGGTVPKGIPGYGTKFLNSGGRVPGSGPNRDTVPAMLTPGEFVVNRNAAKALGEDFLKSINQAHRFDVAGDPSAPILSRHRNNNPARNGLALNSGGWVWAPQYLAAGGNVIVPKVQNWIRKQDPKHYVWGATGPNSFDCSGITGAVYGMLTGRGGGNGQRYFTTSSDFGALGFKPGKGTYTLGLNPGHHVVGNLGGLAFEARSTATGIFVGPSARSVTSMPRQLYLPKVGGNFVNAGDGKGGLGGIARAVINALLRPAKGAMQRLASDNLVGKVASSLGGTALDGIVDTIGKRVGIFHQGGHVQRDQLAFLQAGERVLTRNQDRALAGAGPGLVINVDARGSTSPAAVEAAARRGAEAAAAQVLTTYRQTRTVRPRR